MYGLLNGRALYNEFGAFIDQVFAIQSIMYKPLNGLWAS